MKNGDEEMINGQAELVANIDANIKSMRRSKQKLSIFAMKVNMARNKQNIGAGMVAVSKALGRVSDSIQLERARMHSRRQRPKEATLTHFPQVEQVMENLEKQYEDIDVMTSVLDNATTQSTAREVPQEEIDRIKRQMADEAGIEMSQELNNAAVNVNANLIKAGPTEEEEASITDRLRALRGREVAN